MILLALAIYAQSVSTAFIDSETPENAVIVLRNDANQREVLLIDPTLLFSQTNDPNRSDPTSGDNDLSDTSSDLVKEIIDNKIEPAFRHSLNDNPGSDSLDNHKTGIQSDNETVYLPITKSPLIPRRSILGKETSDIPPWLINGFLKKFKTLALNEIAQLPNSKSAKIQSKQVLENEISERWLYSNSGPSNSLNKSVSENSTTYLPNSGSTKKLSQVQGKEIALDPLRSLSTISGPLNLLTFLKRSRRQAGNVTEELPELPRWPGMPQGVVRRAYVKTSHVKRKILNMMLQSLYSAQERLWPLGPIVQKYEHLTPYRMAFIFMKLDQLVHEGHSIYMYLKRQNLNMAMTMTRRLQLYSQIMRRNVDVTYLVDYIMERVPRDQVVRIRHWVIRHEQEEIMKKKTNWDKTFATRFLQRPNNE